MQGLWLIGEHIQTNLSTISILPNIVKDTLNYIFQHTFDFQTPQVFLVHFPSTFQKISHLKRF